MNGLHNKPLDKLTKQQLIDEVKYHHMKNLFTYYYLVEHENKFISNVNFVRDVVEDCFGIIKKEVSKIMDLRELSFLLTRNFRDDMSKYIDEKMEEYKNNEKD